MPSPTTSTRTALQIRQEFIDFFAEKHGHAFVPSSPVVPHGDPTLLFTNAGMNQFKDVFLGQGKRDYKRAVNSQKCIRAGGKHNDLEDVGKDLYHHTFFEMLGNWSFGDYFKAEAIEWAWELMTGLWGLEPERLHVTVFAGDERDGLDPDLEAEELWKRFVPTERISRWDRKDNFWEMGETGPCGPCSEIHYDFTPDRSGGARVNADDPSVIELWNLVFIQFNRGAGGALTPLPARGVDTGMGLERIVRALQHRESNYDTDLWTPVFKAIETHASVHPYRGRLDDPVDTAYRVIADHVRCLTVAITDGAPPSNEGRGYVLRRILRRAVRHAHQTLGIDGPLLCDLVPSVVETLGSAFPELEQNPQRVAGVIRDEEESFLRTLDRGLALFNKAAERTGAGTGGGTLASEDAFRLHDTYGFPIDLTRVMAEERGLAVDLDGYERLMEQARQTSRRTSSDRVEMTLPPEAMAELARLGVEPTADEDKYHGRPITARIAAIWNGADFDQSAHIGRTVAIVLNRTNHYAESGGQVADCGEIIFNAADFGALPSRGHGLVEGRAGFRFRVEDVQSIGGYVLHVGRVVDGEPRMGDHVQVTIDHDRRAHVLPNHTGTHLLNHALREVVGEEVDQKGSLVAPDRLRFDFSCSHAMSEEQIERAERLVNERIEADERVHAGLVQLELAQRIHGVRAVFGERYPDPVRVVSIGVPIERLTDDPENAAWRGHSIEFCGGTHLERTGTAARLVIVHEQALAAGVRRITALTGVAAAAADAAGRELEERVARAADLEGDAMAEAFDEIGRACDEMTIGAVAKHRVRRGLDAMQDRVRAARRQSMRAARDGVVEQARTLAESDDGPIVVHQVLGADQQTLLAAMDVIRARRPDAAILLLTGDEEAAKVLMVGSVPPSLIERGLKAGDWVKQAAGVCGGGGGGRPDMAQAGGKRPDRIDEAIRTARRWAEEQLS